MIHLSWVAKVRLIKWHHLISSERCYTNSELCILRVVVFKTKQMFPALMAADQCLENHCTQGVAKIILNAFALHKFLSNGTELCKNYMHAGLIYDSRT